MKKFHFKVNGIGRAVRIDLFEGKEKVRSINALRRHDLLETVRSWNRFLYYTGKRERWHIQDQ